MHAPDLPSRNGPQCRYVFTRGFYAPYFVYDREAAPGASLRLILATSSRAAVEEVASGGGFVYSAPLFETPLDAGDVDRMSDPWRVVCLADGRRFFVGRSHWPDDAELTHGALWALLPEEVRAVLHVHWDALHWEAEPHARVDRPRRATQ